MTEPLLALETSTRGGSVALLDGDAIVAERTLQIGEKITSRIQPMIVEILRAASLRATDLSIVAYSHGPGSFTGLRVAATSARILHLAIGCRVIGVPTLQVIAENARTLADPPRHVAILLDARRDESFAAWFELLSSEPGDTRVGAAPTIVRGREWLADVPRPIVCLGSGVASQRDAILASGATIGDESLWTPRATVVGILARRLAARGEFLAPHEIVPHYLRAPECEEVYDVRRAAAVARHRGNAPTP
ncbi:MAG: tRNA (adenosine(37)-N6)-threonylcarbamoyltransferase complex dimerization subunit type 1 TsaB [Phycisphaerae bacterium]